MEFTNLVSIIIGGVVVTLVDQSLSVRWDSYTWWQQLLHKAAYMIWGAIIISL